MNATSRRRLRWLPPLVVLAGVALLVGRAFLDADAPRRREEAALAARALTAADRPALLRDLASHLAAHDGDARSRWFAVETYARAHHPLDALRVWEEDPALRDAPGSARRFAAILLRDLATEPGDVRKPTWLFSRALLARLDVGDPEALALLDDLVPRMDVADVAYLYGPARRARTAGAHAYARAWRRRPADLEFEAAASLLEAVPGAAEDAAILRRGLASEWRVQRPMMWAYIARALGTVGDEASVAALRRERDLSAGPGPDDARRRVAVDVGLAVAGDPEAERRLDALLADPEGVWAAVETVIGLYARHQAGDARAASRLVALVSRAGSDLVLLQAGTSALLSDALPEGLPADAWAAELRRSPRRLGRVVAHAWGLRRAAPDASAALRAELRAALEAKDVLARAQGIDDDDAAAASEVLRAWLRW